MLENFCRSFAALEGPKVLVHGGGVMASSLQQSLGQIPVKIEGRRVTDEAALKAVVMAYSGWCGKNLVAQLQKYGCNAISLSGCDANVIRAQKRGPVLLQDGHTQVDFGFVGDVGKESVNAAFLNSLLEAGIVPVLNAINHDGQGQLLNTNADSIASCVAAALGAELLCCFELDGVLSDRNDPSSVIPCISRDSFASLKASGCISDGMLPKIDACIKALEQGACSAVIKNAGCIADDSGTKICL